MFIENDIEFQEEWKNRKAWKKGFKADEDNNLPIF